MFHVGLGFHIELDWANERTRYYFRWPVVQGKSADGNSDLVTKLGAKARPMRGLVDRIKKTQIPPISSKKEKASAARRPLPLKQS
jgi:hypothetical protein